MKAKTNSKKFVWQSSLFNTTELVIVEEKEFFSVQGYITGEVEGNPLHVSYKLSISQEWSIQSVFIEMQSASVFRLSLHKSGDGQWLNDKGEMLDNFDGCIDIDISLTPFTNTLPVNRLRLQEGNSSEIKVIYFDFPKSEYKVAQQRYTNLGQDIYKFESLSTGFTSNIRVDDEGYVVDYPGIWHRVFPR